MTQRSKTAVAARAHLDAKLLPLKNVNTTVPKAGWLRAVRDSLGMPARHVAEKLRISENAVYGLERSEQHGTIQLNTLRKAADALDCDLAYALVPRRSLEHTTSEAARLKAARDVAAVDKTMALEDQRIAGDQIESRIEQYARDLIESGTVWD